MATTSIDFIDYLLTGTADGSSPTTATVIVGCSGVAMVDKTPVAAFSYTGTTVSITSASQNWYLVDGTNLLKVTAGGVGSTITCGGLAQPPAGARIVALYRNRLVLTRTTSDPQDWFMSRVNDYENFDYTNQNDGVSVAIAGNNSTAGKVGDVITCLIPYNDDFMVMGCSDSVWLMRGDPAANGRIDNLIWGGGIVGPQAFGRDSEGRVYYLSRTDLMMLVPGGSSPQSISQGRLQRFFTSIDFTSASVRMAWDVHNKGLWILFTSNDPASDVHLYWDQRLDAFTLHDFPITITAVRSLAGAVAAERQLLFGGSDGIIYTPDAAFLQDMSGNDIAAIDAYVDFPPVTLADPGQRGMITETELVLGTVAQPDMNMTWRVGDNAQDAINTTTNTISTNTTATGRFLHRGRARGQVAVMRLANNGLGTGFAYESGHVLTSPAAGRTR